MSENLEQQLASYKKEIELLKTKLNLYRKPLTLDIEGIVAEHGSRTQSLKELAATADSFHELMDNIPGVFWRVEQSPEWPVVYFSKGTLHFTGYESEDFMSGKVKWIDLTYAEDLDRLLNVIGAAVEQKKIFDLDYRMVHKDGRIVWIREIGIYLDRGEGKVPYLDGYCIDITQQKENEYALENARLVADKANQTKSVFLANMSHELRTPLNAVIGFSQLLERQPDVPRKALDYIKIIETSGEHLLALINDILDLSRVEAGKASIENNEFDCHQLFISTQNMFSQQMQLKGLQLDLVGVNNLPQYLKTDERKLKQILFNLISNAFKFTEKGNIVVRVNFEDSLLTVEVEDCGSGIEDTEIGLVFEAFGQSESGRQSQQGSGLGLPISRQFARLMGGDLMVTSKINEGSVFCMTIKAELVETIEKSSEANRVSGLASGQPSYRILVVDDGVHNRTVLTSLLSQTGFAVDTAEDGQQAINKANSWQPHLIFMDHRMPVMNGDEATQIIKSTHPEIIIIALSASGLKEDRAKILSSGSEEYIPKPYKEQEIFGVIQKYLNVKYDMFDVQSEDISAESSEQDAKIRQLLFMTDLSWRKQIKQATLIGDINLAKALIEEIRNDHPELEVLLRKLVEGYQHYKITEWLE